MLYNHSTFYLKVIINSLYIQCRLNSSKLYFGFKFQVVCFCSTISSGHIIQMLIHILSSSSYKHLSGKVLLLYMYITASELYVQGVQLHRMVSYMYAECIMTYTKCSIVCTVYTTKSTTSWDSVGKSLWFKYYRCCMCWYFLQVLIAKWKFFILI